MKSPKGKKGGVISKIGDVVQTFSPRNKLKTKRKPAVGDGNGTVEDGDDLQQQQVKEVVPPTTANTKNDEEMDTKEQSENSDDKSEDLLPTFFYEGRTSSGEFSLGSSPFTAQFVQH